MQKYPMAIGDIYEYVHTPWKTKIIIIGDRGDNWETQSYNCFKELNNHHHKFLQNKEELNKEFDSGKYKISGRESL